MRRSHAGLIAAGVIVLAVVVGIMLSSSGSPEKKGRISPSVLDTADLTPAALAPEPPVVTSAYDAQRGAVRFSWHPAHGDRGASYTWFPVDDPTAVTRTAKTAAEVPRSKSAQVCIEVTEISSDGQPSDPARKCG